MGMSLKAIKRLFCNHDYKLVGKDYFAGCLCREYYECSKCGKITCVRWEDGNDKS